MPSVCQKRRGKREAYGDASAVGQWAGPVTVTSGSLQQGQLRWGPTVGRTFARAGVGEMIGIPNHEGNSQLFKEFQLGEWKCLLPLSHWEAQQSFRGR